MPTFVAPRQAIRTGVARIPLPFGLFSVLGFREDGERWVNGIVWETDTCAPIGEIEQWYCQDPAVNAQQSLTVGGEGLESFTITFSEDTTDAIADDASAEDVQTALEGLDGIAPGDVLVTGPAGGPWLVTFTGDLGGQAVALVSTTPTGGTGEVVVAEVTEGSPQDAAPSGLPKDLDKLSTPYGEANPFSVYGHYNCSAVGRNDSLEYGEARADIHLQTREEARVEQALWTGDLNNVPNFAGANGYAAPGNAGTFPIDDADKALAAVEQKLAEDYGSVGVIHMSREVATLLMSKFAVDTKGGRMYTKLGTPVIAGTGYDSTKIVGSAGLIGYRSEIFHPSNRPYDLFDTGNNDLIAVSEREYVVGFDPCGLVAATLTTAE